MKRLKVFIMVCIFSFACSFQLLAQQILPEVVVVSLNYKYINKVVDEGAAEKVTDLQKHAASFNIKKSNYYTDEYETYFVSFVIPDGKILAAYDGNGKLMHTAERFDNIALPNVVRKSIAKKYPQWKIARDIYLVDYQEESGSKKVYKIFLENGNQKMKVKTNELGEFI